MRDSRVVSLVTEDGEVIAVSQQRTPATSYGARFMTVFDAALREIAKEIESGLTLRVLLLLPQYLDWTTFRRLDQKVVASELKAGQSSISKSMVELHKKGLVEREGKGPVTLWKLSTNWGWRGTVDGYHEARRGRQRLRPVPTDAAPIVAEDILWNFAPA